MIQNHKIEKRGEGSKLSELKVGQKAKVLLIDMINQKLKRHLLEMGLTRGTTLEIKRIAPMGDPVCLFFRGYELSVRKKDLEKIIVEVL